MGRDKEQSLVTRLEMLRGLIENNDFENAFVEVGKLNDECFLKDLTPEEARVLASYLENLSDFLSKKERELKEIIQNTKRVKSAYLK